MTNTNLHLTATKKENVDLERKRLSQSFHHDLLWYNCCTQKYGWLALLLITSISVLWNKLSLKPLTWLWFNSWTEILKINDGAILNGQPWFHTCSWSIFITRRPLYTYKFPTMINELGTISKNVQSFLFYWKYITTVVDLVFIRPISCYISYLNTWY